MTEAVARGVNEYLSREGVTAEEIKDWLESHEGISTKEWGYTTKYMRALLRIVVEQQQKLIELAWEGFN